MAIYTDQMFNSAGEDTSLADMNNGTTGTAGRYQPSRDGKLMQVRLHIGYTSAASLIEKIRIELTNTNWIPNTLRFMVGGDGLHTAPAFSGRSSDTSWLVDQVITEKSTVQGQLIHVGGASPVTSNVFVFGTFSG